MRKKKVKLDRDERLVIAGFGTAAAHALETTALVVKKKAVRTDDLVWVTFGHVGKQLAQITSVHGSNYASTRKWRAKRQAWTNPNRLVHHAEIIDHLTKAERELPLVKRALAALKEIP